MLTPPPTPTALRAMGPPPPPLKKPHTAPNRANLASHVSAGTKRAREASLGVEEGRDAGGQGVIRARTSGQDQPAQPEWQASRLSPNATISKDDAKELYHLNNDDMRNLKDGFCQTGKQHLKGVYKEMSIEYVTWEKYGSPEAFEAMLNEKEAEFKLKNPDKEFPRPKEPEPFKLCITCRCDLYEDDGPENFEKGQCCTCELKAWIIRRRQFDQSGQHHGQEYCNTCGVWH